LPIKLRREPIIEAIFELRLTAPLPLHTSLPRILFSGLPNVASIESTPVSGIPLEARRANPALADAPLVRILWGQYAVAIGERILSMSVQLPYPGWQAYRADIALVVRSALTSGLITRVDRYSIKYVNLIEIADRSSQLTAIDWTLQLGPIRAQQGQPAQARVEVTDGQLRTIINLATHAEAQLVSGVIKSGVLVDVDTLNETTQEVGPFLASLDERLDYIRQKNKEVFFACLTRQTLDALEPVYAKNFH
jgi:uncharacterized protein (TIGR04255 family)